VEGDLEGLKNVLPKLAGEYPISVYNNGQWGAFKFNGMIKEELCNCLCCVWV
jgi:hypothetical protein